MSFILTTGSITDIPSPLASGEVRWYTFDIVNSPLSSDDIMYDLGPVGYASLPLTLSPDSAGTGSAPSLGIFDANGSLLDLWNDVDSWSTIPLGAGTYYLAITAQSAFGSPFACIGWDDGEFPFDITIDDAATGVPQVRIAGNLRDDFVRYYRFEIVEPVCTFTCPSPGMGEGEAAFDQTNGADDVVNGACTAPGSLTTPAVLGQLWCGSSRAQLWAVDDGMGFFGTYTFADLDFYELIVPAAMNADVLLDSTQSSLIRIIDPAALNAAQCDLNSVTPIAAANTVGCAGPQGVTNVLLSPGTYLALVQPAPMIMMPDAPYSLDFIGRPASPTMVGGVAPANTPFTISTAGSNFDTKIALYDANGTLIDTNDDYDDLTSRLDVSGLPVGDYYLMAIG